MDRLRSVIAPSSTICAKAWTEQRGNGPKNSLRCSKLIGPPSAFRRVKRRSRWHIKRKRSSWSTSACRHSAWKGSIETKMMHNSAWSWISQRKSGNKQRFASQRHKKVKVREFQVEDLVLKRVIQTTREKDQGKFRPNWEGPYTIITRGSKRLYTFFDQGEKILKKQWNFFNLKRYYV